MWRVTMNSVATLEKSRRIRVLNDNLRTTFIGGRVVVSAGVTAMSLDVKAHVFIHVQAFADFDEDNDPYGEHDFGIAGETFYCAPINDKLSPLTNDIRRLACLCTGETAVCGWLRTSTMKIRS